VTTRVQYNKQEHTCNVHFWTDQSIKLYPFSAYARAEQAYSVSGYNRFSNPFFTLLYPYRPFQRPKGKGKGSTFLGRGIALPFLRPRHWRWGWGLSTTPRPLYPRERPGTHCISRDLLVNYWEKQACCSVTYSRGGGLIIFGER
jgi:hypothetical protein